VDVSGTGGQLTPDVRQKLAAASPATASVTANVTPGGFPKMLTSYEFTAGVVDPAAYSALLSGTPAPAPPPEFSARPPDGAPVPVVTSPQPRGRGWAASRSRCRWPLPRR